MTADGGTIRIGTAGWTLPREWQDAFPAEGSHLARYASVFRGTEINSSFHRAHRRSTYERWGRSVPVGFRFAVKLPRAITHDQRLVACDTLLDVFLDEATGLGERLGPWLFQLPPSLAFHADSVHRFMGELRQRVAGDVVCEPRHESWFGDEADALLREHRVARAAADPARVPAAAHPGGWPGLAYYRLHGSPRMYYSAYEATYLAALAGRLRAHRDGGQRVWCIFDNTTLGKATGNALETARHAAS